MKLATTLRYVQIGEGGPWQKRYYIMHDYKLMAEKYGIGMMAIMSEYDLEDICGMCDGLIIPGTGTLLDSKYYTGIPSDPPPVVDEYYLDSKIIRYFYEHRKPIFGICGGHQWLNVFFGGDIALVDDPENHYDHKTNTHEINIVGGSFVYDVFGKERATVNCYHRRRTAKLAPDLKVVATTDDGVVEALEWREKNIYSTQWHPEQSFHTGNPIEQLFFENFLKRCEECK